MQRRVADLFDKVVREYHVHVANVWRCLQELLSHEIDALVFEYVYSKKRPVHALALAMPQSAP